MWAGPTGILGSLFVLILHSKCIYTVLPNVPHPRMFICILANAADIDRAKQIEELEYSMSVDNFKSTVAISFITFTTHHHFKLQVEQEQEASLKNMMLSLHPWPYQANSPSPWTVDQEQNYGHYGETDSHTRNTGSAQPCIGSR